MSYIDGYQLAENDVKRFGTLFAMDKMALFTDEFQDGYASAIKDLSPVGLDTALAGSVR